MVPGGREIALETGKLMEKYDAVIWAHHGMFCSGENFDLTFGLMHTIEKSAEILIKVLSMKPDKLQTITPDNFRDLAVSFHLQLRNGSFTKSRINSYFSLCLYFPARGKTGASGNTGALTLSRANSR